MSIGFCPAVIIQEPVGEYRSNFLYICAFHPSATINWSGAIYFWQPLTLGVGSALILKGFMIGGGEVGAHTV